MSVRAAAPTTFAMFAIGALASVPAALLGSGAIAGAVAEHPDGTRALYAPGSAYLIDAVFDARVGPAFAALFIAAAVMAVLSPGLTVAWLAALRDGSSWANWRLGFGRFFAALLAALMMLPLALVAIGVAIGGAALVHYAPLTLSAPVHDALFVLAMIPGALMLAVFAAAHDVARAALLEDAVSPPRAIAIAFRHLRARHVAIYLALSLGGLALLGLAEAIGFAIDGPDFRAAGVMAITQLAALGKTGLRAAWLDRALAVAPSSHEQRAEAEQQPREL